MITSSRNIDTTKPSPHKQNRFWLKWSIALTVLLLIWLIPYFFSNFLFSNVIKNKFSEYTKQQYALTFENLRINILKGEIVFYSTQIDKLNIADTIKSPNINLQSETLLFSSIDIQAFRKKHVLKFKKLYINKLKLNFENLNAKNDKQSLLNPLNSFLTQVKVSNFKVAEAQINYKQDNDSIFIPALSFELQDLRIDSLRDTVINNRFHIKNIDLQLKKQQIYLPNRSHLISCNLLKFSTQEKYFEIDGLNIKPLQKPHYKQTYTADITKFKLENFEFDSLIEKKQFLAKNFDLEINYLNVQLNSDSIGRVSSDLQKRLEEMFNKTFERVLIDTGRITIAKSQLNFEDNQQLNFADTSKLLIDNFIFDPKNKNKFSLVNGVLSLNNLLYSNPPNKITIQLSHSQLEYQNKILGIIGFDFASNSKVKLQLRLKEIKLEVIDWLQLINNNILLANKLSLTDGDFVQLSNPKSNSIANLFKEINSKSSILFKLVKIKTIQFENWNYSLPSKKILSDNIYARLNNFQLPSNANLSFGAFSDFNANINQFSWFSTDQRHHFLANNIDVNSQSQEINISNIQGFPLWNTINNKLIRDNTWYKLYSQNIKFTTQKPFIQISLNDTILLNELSIDSLNLKQFGKNINKEKVKSIMPLIYISSFKLGKGNFAAYSDSSIVNSIVQINGIHIQGDSLVLYNDTRFHLNYQNLIALTKKGFYQNKEKGLSFNFRNIDFDSKNKSMGLHQFKAELSSELKDKSSNNQLNSELVQIKGFDYNLFLQQNLISANELTINSPTLVSKSNSNGELKKIDFRYLFSPENLQELPYLEFDRFIISDFTWLATYTVKGITTFTTFEKANLEALDFQLSSRSFIDSDRILFSHSINFQIGNYKQHFQNGNYLLMINDIEFSSFNKQMNFDKIQFYTLQQEGQNNYNFFIDQITFNDINFADFQQNFNLTVDNILINKPVTKLHFFGFNENSIIKNLNTLELYPSLQPYFSQIKLNTLVVSDMKLQIEAPNGNSSNIYTLGNLNLQMQNFKLDSTTQAFKDNRFFYSLNTLVHLRDYSAQIANDFYRLNFADLRLSTRDGIVEINSISLKPNYNYEDFAKRMQYQSDRFDITINKIRLAGIDFQDVLFREKYTARRVDINNLIGEAYRDGLYPRLPDYYPLNPIQRLLALPYFIQVDSLLINDSYFAYKEKGANTENPGFIFFDKLNAKIFNATNNPDFIKFGGSTVLNAQARLMGKSKLYLDAYFPLLDQGKSFKLHANLSQIEVEDLEPILKPLALIQVRSGTIKSVNMSVEANDDYALGNMTMLYDNMKVEVLNKSMKKGFLASLFANAMIRTENLNLVPRTGPIYFERRKDRSLFNYWAEISILGMKTSMGLADRRIAKKKRKLQEKK